MGSIHRSLTALLNRCTLRIEGENIVGTGFWISSNLILTCAHLFPSDFKRESDFRVTWRNQEIDILLKECNLESDLALLEARGIPEKHPCVLLSDIADVGDKLYTFGYTEAYKEGEPASPEVEGYSEDPLLIKLKNAQISPGLSGAPLLNLRTGSVCGVIKKTRDRGSALGGRAIPTSAIFSTFPAVKGQQDNFHSNDRRWRGMLTEDQSWFLAAAQRRDSFLGRVAQLYRLLHYSIEFDYEFSGRPADLYIQRRIGDYLIQRAIKCAPRVLTPEDFDDFLNCVRGAKKKHPGIQGAVVSASPFSSDVRSRAASEVQLIAYRDLEAQLLDGNGYAIALKMECEENSQYNLQLYIESEAAYELRGKGEPVVELVNSWLLQADSQQLTLLGDVGTGKTFLTRVIAHDLAIRYLENPIDAPLPIRIDLRHADRQFTIEGLVLSHLSQNGLSDVTFDIFRHSLTNGRIVLLLDGFDEMSARITPKVTIRNFHEIVSLVGGRAKVLLTCRTHYFRSRSEEEEIILGSTDDYSSESVRELYWDIISRKGFQIAYLRSFTLSHIEEYVRRVKGIKARGTITKIRNIYNLMELCQRPLLLDMIVKCIDKIKAKEVTAANLYKVFTDAWISRDQWRGDILSSADKLSFVQALARSLHEDRTTVIHYSQLSEYLQEELALLIYDSRALVEIDNEIRTASFLTRDDLGNYGFAHKSYREYFLARSLASSFEKDDASFLDIAQLSSEVCGFLVDLIPLEHGEKRLARMLTEGYKPRISENALVLLYTLQRASYLSNGVDLQSLVVELPEAVDLHGAKLDQVNLEGAKMHRANLKRASLSEAILSRVDLSGSDLSFANLEKAELPGALLNKASLEGATLRNSNLEKAIAEGASLESADLNHANVSGFNCRGSIFAGVRFLNSEVPARLNAPVGNEFFEDAVRRLVGGQLSLSMKEELEGFYPTIREIAKLVCYNYAIHGELDPDDLASEFAIRALEGRVGKDKMGDRAYLNAVLKNIALARLKKTERREIPISETGMENWLASETNLEAELTTKEMIRMIRKEMPERAWRVFQMRLLHEMTIGQIAETEGVSASTVSRLIAQGRTFLFERLSR